MCLTAVNRNAGATERGRVGPWLGGIPTGFASGLFF
jgi:hypothetical protein